MRTVVSIWQEAWSPSSCRRFSHSVMADLHTTPFAFRDSEKLRAHELGHHHELAHPPKPALPIPDLRFEYSYLRSIRPFVKLIRTATLPLAVTKTHEDDEDFERVEKEKEENGEESTAAALTKSETLDIQWKRVIWATTRDQLLTPFFQGALWALASFYLSPWGSGVGKKMGSYVRSKLPAEGSGSAWLRGVVRQLGLSSNAL